MAIISCTDFKYRVPPGVYGRVPQYFWDQPISEQDYEWTADFVPRDVRPVWRRDPEDPDEDFFVMKYGERGFIGGKDILCAVRSILLQYPYDDGPAPIIVHDVPNKFYEFGVTADRRFVVVKCPTTCKSPFCTEKEGWKVVGVKHIHIVVPQDVWLKAYEWFGLKPTTREELLFSGG